MSSNLVQRVSVKDSSASRVSWSPTFFKFPNNFQLLLVYKNYRGTLSFHSMTGARSTSRIPFGQVAKCEFYCKKNTEGEMSQYLNFSNQEGQKVDFNMNILNFFTMGVSPINQALTQMKTDQKFDLICQYLNLVTRSKEFGLHRPDLHTEQGLRLDGSGVTEETLEKSGGSLEDYTRFLQLAKTSAQEPPSRKKKMNENTEDKIKKAKKSNENVENVENVENASPIVMKETKVTDFFGKKEKLSKSEEMDKLFEEEINEPDGVEQTFVRGLFGRADIDLDQLTVSPKLGMVTNHLRVEKIKKSMVHRYDPTLCLMICPENDEKFDPNELNTNRYHVITGCHCLKALKKIDEEGGKAIDINNTVILK